MPEFNTFRMNEKLLGRSIAIRRTNPCLDNLNVNNPKFNKEIKVRTVEVETCKTYEDWVKHVLNIGKIKLKDNTDNVKTEIEYSK